MKWEEQAAKAAWLFDRRKPVADFVGDVRLLDDRQVIERMEIRLLNG